MIVNLLRIGVRALLVLMMAGTVVGALGAVGDADWSTAVIATVVIIFLYKFLAMAFA